MVEMNYPVLRHRLLVLTVSLLVLSCNIYAQTKSGVFEIRHFTNDPKANGETDFKGETDWMDTEQRVRFLSDYADFASEYYENPNLDKQIVTDEEISALLGNIKPQPLTNIRNTIPLNGWKTYGYKTGQKDLKSEALRLWSEHDGITITDGRLTFNNTKLEKTIEPMTWRFKLETNVMLSENSQFTFGFHNKEKTAFSVSLGNIKSKGKNKPASSHVQENEWVKVTIEGDFTQKRFNFYLDDKLVQDFELMNDTSVNEINKVLFNASGICEIDDLFLFNHQREEDANYPYSFKLIWDENFEFKLNV